MDAREEFRKRHNLGPTGQYPHGSIGQHDQGELKSALIIDREHNKLIEIDDIYARELNSTRVMDKSHAWQCWEDMFAIKQAIEASGYKTRQDVEGVIQALEGMQMKNSIGHPQGDKMLRKEDHVGIIDCYISRVENGRLEVKKKIPKEELVKHMPVRFNLSTMPA